MSEVLLHRGTSLTAGTLGPGVPLPSEEGTTLRKVVMAFTGEPRLESGLDCLIQGLLEIKDTHRPRVLP